MAATSGVMLVLIALRLPHPGAFALPAGALESPAASVSGDDQSAAGAAAEAAKQARKATPSLAKDTTVGCVFLSCSPVTTSLANARTSYSAGRYAEALGFCDAVGDSKKWIPNKYRLEALYLSGMILFSSDAGFRNVDGGRARFE